MWPVPGVVGAVPVAGKGELKMVFRKEDTSAHWQLHPMAATPFGQRIFWDTVSQKFQNTPQAPSLPVCVAWPVVAPGVAVGSAIPLGVVPPVAVCGLVVVPVPAICGSVVPAQSHLL